MTHRPEPTYLAEIPHGLGMNIDPSVESRGMTEYVWRCLSKPDYWTDGGWGKRGEMNYIATLLRPEWDAEAELAAAACSHREFWLVGKDSQEITHPTDAAMFSHEWAHRTTGQLGLPGIRVGKLGLAWLDDYLDVGGRIPAAWHIHIKAPWEQWRREYNTFLAWMRRRHALRPVVVTGVEAGTEQRPAHSEFAGRMVSEGLMTLHYLSGIFWSTAYDPQRWGASMLFSSLHLSSLGKTWVAAQKEWRDARTANRPRPAWDLLGVRDRERDGRPSRRRLDGGSN